MSQTELVNELIYILNYAPKWVYDDFVRKNDIKGQLQERYCDIMVVNYSDQEVMKNKKSIQGLMELFMFQSIRLGKQMQIIYMMAQIMNCCH